MCAASAPISRFVRTRAAISSIKWAAAAISGFSRSGTSSPARASAASTSRRVMPRVPTMQPLPPIGQLADDEFAPLAERCYSRRERHTAKRKSLTPRPTGRTLARQAQKTLPANPVSVGVSPTSTLAATGSSLPHSMSVQALRGAELPRRSQPVVQDDTASAGRGLPPPAKKLRHRRSR